jgi:uncharacterized repeat protein (TIGR02543 family)
MKKVFLLKSMLLLCALIVGSSSVWAEEETITAKQFGFTSNTNLTGANATLTATNFTLTFAQNESTTPPVYNSNSEEFRLYKIASGKTNGATITIAAISENVTFNKVVFEFSNLPTNYSFSSGSYTASTNTWTGDATSSLTLTNTDFSGQLKIKSMTITYQIASSTDPSATLSTTSLDFGEVEVEKTSHKTFTVTPANLTGNLTIASNNGKYTVSPTTIAQDASGAQTITVTAAPTAWNDDMAGTITISGGGLTSNKTVTLTASPYQVANVTLIGDNGTFKVNNEPATSLTFTSRVGNTAAIKAEPNEHYTFTSWAAEGATPESSEIPYQVFTFTAATVTLTATFTEDAKHTATFYVLGAESEIEVYEGDAITFPSVTAPTGYTFMGWTANEISTAQSAAPADLTTSANMGDANVTYYAVFAKATEGGDDTYEKLTSNSFDTNATYVIAGTQNATSTTVCYLQSYSSTDVDVSWGIATTSPATETPITFTLSGTASALVAKDNSGNYLTCISVKKFAMSSTSTTVYLDEDGGIKSASNGNYLRYNYNTGNGGFRWYAGQTTGTQAYFYKVIPGITYSDYCTTIPPVTANITDAGYATFSSDKNVDFHANDGLTVFTAEQDGTKIILREVESKKVPANNAVVLKGNKGSYNGTVVVSADALTDNDLKVAENDMDGSAGNIYVLNKVGDKVGFYKLSATGTLEKGKAYLESDGNAPFLGFDGDDETTGIQNVERTVNDNQYYTLDGRRVAEPTKGIYIINGKKVVIK